MNKKHKTMLSFIGVIALWVFGISIVVGFVYVLADVINCLFDLNSGTDKVPRIAGLPITVMGAMFTFGGYTFIKEMWADYKKGRY